MAKKLDVTINRMAAHNAETIQVRFIVEGDDCMKQFESMLRDANKVITNRVTECNNELLKMEQEYLAKQKEQKELELVKE